MEEMVRVAETLRRDHDFGGYIHLKPTAGASQELVERAGRAADRLSVNVELPVDEALVRLAPQKDALVIRKAMGDFGCASTKRKKRNGKRRALCLSASAAGPNRKRPRGMTHRGPLLPRIADGPL